MQNLIARGIYTTKVSAIRVVAGIDEGPVYLKEPLDLAAGIHDGHSGSVPVRQTLDAFNAVARAGGNETVGEDEIQCLSRTDGRLENPKPSDLEPDGPYGREIYLRRHAGPARVTIFEGGHEGLAGPAIAWLAPIGRSKTIRSFA